MENKIQLPFNLPDEKIFILFDGVCNFCNNTVNMLISKDKKDHFRFIALQSELGQKICKHLQIDTSKIDSIIYYEPNVVYYIKSGAAFAIAKNLGGLYSFINIFSFIPASVTDFIYDFIAKNRYKWFGKRDQCMMPDAKIKEKFLE
jgi:predicted DCC family thiol-disulfide oxidoreductase YuxK